MPVSNIERPRLPGEMRDALKRHILRERQRKKEEADANEADKQRRRAEKVRVTDEPFRLSIEVRLLGQSVVVVESSTGGQRQGHPGIGTNTQ